MKTPMRKTGSPARAGSLGSDALSARPNCLILVVSSPGQPSVGKLEREASAGTRPRKDYVELARMLDAHVVDADYMTRRATPLARLVSRIGGLAAGQVVEAFLRRRQYATIIAWSDRLGLSLALLLKIVRSRQRVVLVSVRLTNRSKAFLVKRLKAYSHIHAIAGRRYQMQIAETDLRVPPDKILLEPQGVDDSFWSPRDTGLGDVVSVIGWLERDYTTLAEAIRGLPIKVEAAIGSIYLPDSPDLSQMLQSRTCRPDVARTVGSNSRQTVTEELPENLSLRTYNSAELRELYARSRFVLVPVLPVEWDAGVTAITEAMAMGKAVIATRTPALADLFTDGEAGLFVEPGDVSGWRAAIQYLLDHPAEAERMGNAGRAVIAENHRLDDCMIRLADIARGAAVPRRRWPRS